MRRLAVILFAIHLSVPADAAPARRTDKAGTNRAVARTAWFHGIPGDTASGGVRFEIANLSPPGPRGGRMSLTLLGSDELAQKLGHMARSKSRLAHLSLVVREDSTSTRSVIYRLSDVTVKPLRGSTGTARTLQLNFRGAEILSALTGNPGPPPNAPAVRRDGPNKGWLHGVSTGASQCPLEVEVLEFAPLDGKGQLRMRMAGPGMSSAFAGLRSTSSHRSPLILVLPDRDRGIYVEFKLWDPTLESIEAAPSRDGKPFSDVVLRSPMIEYMAGNPTGD